MKCLPLIFSLCVLSGMLGASPWQAPRRSLQSAFAPPSGYHRLGQSSASFGAWLRNCPMKPAGAVVHLYDGRVKAATNVYAGVLDLDIGTSDLQQCADAVMRLRAEYLFSRERFGEIGFHFTNGFYADYQHWRDGYRVAVAGATAKWVRRAAPDGSYAQFRRYLETVFSYAGTRSLEKELRSVPLGDMQPGDVLIRGGSPGHAVLVMDVAANASGQKCFLLSQSYMPAQDIHVLREPTGRLDGVWYALPAGPATIETPEWDFTTAQLRRFALPAR